MRLFNTHKYRKTISLNGVWKAEKKQGETFDMYVPACWETVPGFENYRGKIKYTKTVNIEHTQNLRFVFKGVSHTADVYFDGEKIVHHYNAYTPFDAIVKDVKAGEHELAVWVDNTFSEDSALHKENDYYTYGGITRPAGYEIIGDVYIKNMHFTPGFNGEIWHGKTETQICNISDSTASVDFEIEIAGVKKNFKNIEIQPGCIYTVTDENEYTNVKPWTHETPNLYMINCTLYKNGECIDDLADRCGFRTVEVDGKDILLNGKKVFLKGFNRHEDHPTAGCAIPPELMIKDINLMKDMGANAVRTSHYPNDERFLDLCDETGLLVWEENHARGLRIHDMKNPNFERQCADCIDEMIYNHYNHPSIIIWAILNECASADPEGSVMYKKQFKQIRSLDTSRPLTSASDRHYADLCLGMQDIISFNIYSGWYYDNPIDGELNKELAWIRTAGGENKPFIMSEFGGAAMYGNRDSARRKWSEEFQSDLLVQSLDVYMNHPDVSGVFIWQFCDCRVTDEGEWWFSRACMRNNKGIVDMYRRPKLAYETVKTKFKEKK